MGLKFLSEEWFAKVDELIKEAGDLETPDALSALTINMTVETDDGEQKVHLTGGQFYRDHKDDAPATVVLSSTLAKQLFIEHDANAGMQAFMSGEMRVEGDVSQLMVLQTVQPSDPMKDLAEDIKEITD